ncbi:transposase [Anoxybacter fermentans]|uniref:Transposase n=1 Tax=Anoxybacter fermentans TaxID=1323375 RepID=A0A3S9T0H3_9FIRM|nr:IS110 family transposase [Anoxybacter fermentans]AZR73922.1 transposase [Anoxybacter fermentans]
MQILHERCCGLDVHKKSITACIITPEGKKIRTFGTMTADILELVDWIKQNKCSCVAMESTGVYWKPIYNLLEVEQIETLVVNARHIKAVPGRKTDVKDAEWIAELLQYGLLKGSYIPSREQRELQELIRYRRSLIDERSREVNRLQKILEGANIKLSSVATDILGKSGRKMLEQIINSDKPDPKIIAQSAKGKLRNKIPLLEKALHGLIGHHQKMILSVQLRHIDFLDQQIEELNLEIERRMRPFEDCLELLDTIPGVGRRIAEQIIAEIGVDMSRFPSSKHLASWAGIAPGNNESAGKRKSGRTTKGNKHLRSTLVEAARSASRTKNTYLSAQYRRLAARRGSNRACIAVAHTILTIVYHILKKKQPYQELGADYFEKRKESKIVNNLIRKLERLGYSISIKKKSA